LGVDPDVVDFFGPVAVRGQVALEESTEAGTGEPDECEQAAQTIGVTVHADAGSVKMKA
jgi:hypothetical protein